MAFDIGINFRATADYVTDGTGQTYCLGDAYPVTRGGATFGFVLAGGAGTSAAGNSRNRSTSSSLAPELAGIVQVGNTAAARFQLDLPAAGDYDLTIALGDASFGGNQYAWIYDGHDQLGGTLLATVASGVATTAGSFVDINGDVRTGAEWKAERSTLQFTFANTKLVVLYGAKTSGVSGNSALAHLRVQSASGGGSPTIPVAAKYLYLRRMGGH